MKAQINSLTIEESHVIPTELPKGKRVTFPVCFSGCEGIPYKVGTQWGAVINTKNDFCPHCHNALFWVSERK